MTVQQIIEAEDDKLCSIDRDKLSADADAICKSLSAVAGMLAAVALAIDDAAQAEGLMT